MKVAKAFELKMFFLNLSRKSTPHKISYFIAWNLRKLEQALQPIQDVIDTDETLIEVGKCTSGKEMEEHPLFKKAKEIENGLLEEEIEVEKKVAKKEWLVDHNFTGGELAFLDREEYLSLSDIEE